MRTSVWTPCGGPTGAIRIPFVSSRAVQVFRDLRHRGGDDDAVEGADIGGQVVAVRQHDLDIVAAGLLEAPPGGVRQGPKAFDRQYGLGEPGQDRCLIAGAGADLEHPMVLLKLQLLGHVGHHEGLADGLAAGNAERAVAIGFGAIAFADKVLPRDLLQRPQDRLIADPAPPQVQLKHHFLWRALLGRHLSQPRRVRSGNRRYPTI